MAGAGSYVFNKAPTVADFPQFNGSWISNLPNDYWQGQQYKYNRDLQTLFQPGHPGADQLQGFPPLMQTVARAGGVPALGPLFPTLVQAQIGAGVNRDVFGGGPGGNTNVASTQPASTGAPFAGNPATGSDNSGDTTVRSLLPGDQDYPQAVMDRIATAAGVKASGGMSAADQPLTPQQAQRVQQIISARSSNSPGVAQPGTGAPAPVEQPKGAIGNAPFMASSSKQGAGPANIGGTQVASTNPEIGAAEASVSDGGTDTSSPPPPSANSPTNRALAEGPSATTGQEVGRAPIQRPGDTEQALKTYEARIANARQSVSRAGGLLSKEQSENLNRAIDTWQKEHDQMLERMNKQRELDYGVTVDRTKAENSAYLKKFNDIQDVGNIAGISSQKSGIVRSFLSDPNYVSGFGEHGILNYRKIMAQIDPTFHGNDAQAQEVVRKFWSDSLRDKIKELAKAGVGRIMLAEVRIAEKANANQENTPASNRTLAYIDDRFNKYYTHLAEMASGYKGGNLDKGWEDAVRKDLKQNPIFTDEEIRHPEYLGAPDAPTGLDKNGKAEWIRKMSLKPGDAIRMPGGHYQFVK